ncbi:MAG: glycosyltransferase family 4 protein [Candidatus Altiarchaeota archaeon]
MRVLEVTTSYPRYRGDFPGIFNFRLDRELVQKGFDVTVLAPEAYGYPTEETMDGVKVKRLKYFWPSNLQQLAYGGGMKHNVFTKPWLIIQIPVMLMVFFGNIIFRSREYDLLHCHWLPLGLLGVLAKPLIKKPVVISLWGTDYRDLPRWFGRFVVSRADAVVSSATETSKYLESIGCLDFEWIPTPIDENEFDPTKTPTDILDEFKIGDRKVVTFIGRLDPLKDPQTFVESVPHVIKKRGDVMFFLVGGGDMIEDLRLRANHLGVRDHIIFTGSRTDVARILRVSSLFTALSPAENTWSTSIAEAMFMDVPLILTDVGHTAEFFTHLVDSYIIPPKDPKRLAEAIVYLLDNPDVGEKLVEGSRNLLKKSGKRRGIIVGNTIKLYNRMINK